MIISFTKNHSTAPKIRRVGRHILPTLPYMIGEFCPPYNTNTYVKTPRNQETGFLLRTSELTMAVQKRNPVSKSLFMPRGGDRGAITTEDFTEDFGGLKYHLPDKECDRPHPGSEGRESPSAQCNPLLWQAYAAVQLRHDRCGSRGRQWVHQP